MVNCSLCPHHKARSEAPGFVECKAPMPTTSIIPAFYAFYETGRVDDPFTVIRRANSPPDAGAWPLQYQAESIEFCAVWASGGFDNSLGVSPAP